jgi:hypothetical protein
LASLSGLSTFARHDKLLQTPNANKASQPHDLALLARTLARSHQRLGCLELLVGLLEIVPNIGCFPHITDFVASAL